MFDLKKSSRQRCDGLDTKHGKKMCRCGSGWDYTIDLSSQASALLSLSYRPMWGTRPPLN